MSWGFFWWVAGVLDLVIGVSVLVGLEYDTDFQFIPKSTRDLLPAHEIMSCFRVPCAQLLMQMPYKLSSLPSPIVLLSCAMRTSHPSVNAAND